MCALFSKRNMVDTNDDLEIMESLLSTSIASAPGDDDEEQSGIGSIVDAPIKEMPFIATDMRSDCCSDKSVPNENKK